MHRSSIAVSAQLRKRQQDFCSSSAPASAADFRLVFWTELGDALPRQNRLRYDVPARILLGTGFPVASTTGAVSYLRPTRWSRAMNIRFARELVGEVRLQARDLQALSVRFRDDQVFVHLRSSLSVSQKIDDFPGAQRLSAIFRVASESFPPDTLMT